MGGPFWGFPREGSKRGGPNSRPIIIRQENGPFFRPPKKALFLTLFKTPLKRPLFSPFLGIPENPQKPPFWPFLGLFGIKPSFFSFFHFKAFFQLLKTLCRMLNFYKMIDFYFLLIKSHYYMIFFIKFIT